MTDIPLIDLQAQYREIRPEIRRVLDDVLDSQHFILGDQVAALEDAVADYHGVDHAVGLNSGTDALILSLRALGVNPGDEVIVPAFSFFATVEAVLHIGAKPVFVDVDPDTFNLQTEELDDLGSPETAAIIPVHLYGQSSDMAPVLDWAEDRGVAVVEDSAQAFGATYEGEKTGSMGEVGCLSFFPSKNLGGFGDGGMVVTGRDDIAEAIRMLRTHGWKDKYHPETVGYNSRLDEIQAAVLRVKLDCIDGWNRERREAANRYDQMLGGIGVDLPDEADGVHHVYHMYTIQTEARDAVREHLHDDGIATGVYYPRPLHLTAPCRAQGWTEGEFPTSETLCDRVLSIPMFPEITDAQQERVASSLKKAVAAEAGST